MVMVRGAVGRAPARRVERRVAVRVERVPRRAAVLDPVEYARDRQARRAVAHGPRLVNRLPTPLPTPLRAPLAPPLAARVERGESIEVRDGARALPVGGPMGGHVIRVLLMVGVRVGIW